MASGIDLSNANGKNILLVNPDTNNLDLTIDMSQVTTLSQVQAEISTGGNLVTNPAGAIGYGVGAGGTVTQLTSKSTAVTLNKPTGTIIMNGAALAGGASVTFTLNNSLLSSQDTIIVTKRGGTSLNYNIDCGNDPSAAYITITNRSGGSLSEAIGLNFTIINGANS